MRTISDWGYEVYSLKGSLKGCFIKLKVGDVGIEALREKRLKDLLGE